MDVSLYKSAASSLQTRHGCGETRNSACPHPCLVKLVVADQEPEYDQNSWHSKRPGYDVFHFRLPPYSRQSNSAAMASGGGASDNLPAESEGNRDQVGMGVGIEHMFIFCLTEELTVPLRPELDSCSDVITRLIDRVG